jgi:hypothetical protein
MSSFERKGHSFVLRLWTESRDEPESPAEWRGWINHVPSGQRHYFQDFADIGRIVSAYVNDTSTTSVPATRQ